MTSTRNVTVTRRPVNADKLGYFRFGSLGSRVIITNEYGEWHIFDDEGVFHRFLAGEVEADSDLGAALSAKGFLRDAADLEHIANSVRRRKKYVGMGPSVHVVHLADDHGTLGVETCKDIVDFAMLSTSSAIEYRVFPGSTVDLDLLGFLVQYSTEKNRYEGKAVTYRLVVDPAKLDEEAVTFLIDKRFKVRMPVDGPLSDDTIAGIGRLNEAAGEKKREGWAVEADITVSAANAHQLVELAASLHGHGVRRARLRPVLTGPDAIGADAFGEAFRAFVDKALSLSADGAPFVEELAATLVTKATSTDAATDVELRSPAAPAAGLVAYDTQGNIYPSDVARTADDPEMFKLGTAGTTAYKEATTHPTARALTLASLLECLPGFATHWATPFLGVDPLQAWATTGDLFPHAPSSPDVAAQLAAVEVVFDVLSGDDEATADGLRGWAE